MNSITNVSIEINECAGDFAGVFQYTLKYTENGVRKMIAPDSDFSDSAKEAKGKALAHFAKLLGVDLK